MKYTLLLSLVCLSLNAQTNTQGTNVPPTTFPLVTLGVSTNVVTVANDLAKMLSPMIPYLTNHSITLGVSPLYGQGKFGEMAFLLVPTAENSPLSIGIGEAYAGGDMFIAPISAKIGTTITIPVINRKVYIFAAEGLTTDISKNFALGSQSTVGGVTGWDINSQLGLYTEGGYVKFTELSGNDWFFGLMLNWHPTKW